MGVTLDQRLGARAEERCRLFARPPFSEAAGNLTRLYLTPAHRAALDQLTIWMQAAGMTTRIDAAASLVGRYEGAKANAPALVFGSHIDSVRDAGAYDGPLGVMLGLAVVEHFHAQGKRLPFALEVIAFGDEEGSRFQASMNASRAFAGRIDQVSALAVKDRDGVTLADALKAFGLEPSAIATAKRARGDVLAFIEAHIEQGPVLEAQGAALGVVTSIAGQWRLKARFKGQAGHAGTTPMPMRRDALAAAAEAILAAERIAAEGPPDLVATVGQVQARPGAPNVIPGFAEITLDIRAGEDKTRDAGMEAIVTELSMIATRRGVTLDIERVQNLPASAMDRRLQAMMGAAIEQIGLEAPRLVSGAGHDAMMIAGFVPAAMLFIRCAGGISHNPAESVTAEDCDHALAALVAFVEMLASDAA